MSAESLYQQVIIAGSRDTAHVGDLPAGQKTYVSNPLCGDDLTLYTQAERGVFNNIRYTCAGCAICKASAAMLAKTLTGQTTAQAAELSKAFQGSLTGHNSAVLPDELKAFAELKNYPTRKRCGTLPWEALDAILEKTS